MNAFRNAFSGSRGAAGWWAGLLILGYGIFLTLPAGWSGYVIGHDTLSHLIMSRHFVDQLWAGDLCPRWLYGMNAGLGSPVFQFYGPVSYYFTALFRPLLGHDPEGWHQLGLAASLAVIASGFTAYAWLGRLAGRRTALIGAVLYMSAPYHLAVDLYQRFVFAELWGFVWWSGWRVFGYVVIPMIVVAVMPGLHFRDFNPGRGAARPSPVPRAPGLPAN